MGVGGWGEGKVAHPLRAHRPAERTHSADRRRRRYKLTHCSLRDKGRKDADEIVVVSMTT